MKWVRGKAGSKTQQWSERLFGPVGAALPVQDKPAVMSVGGSDVHMWIVDPDRMIGLDCESLYIHLAERWGVTYAEATKRTLVLPVDDCQEVPACSKCGEWAAYDEGLCWLCHTDDFVDGLKAGV